MKPINYREALCSGFSDPAAAVAALKQSGWRARADTDRWPVAVPVDWAADPFHDVNWRFQLNAWRPAEILMCAHDRPMDDTLLDDIVDLMLDWGRYEAATQNDDLLWNDMGAGMRAAKLAYVLTQPGLADDRFEQARPALVALARRHLKRLRDPAFIGTTNHALFQVHGALALCRVLPDVPEAQGGEAYVEAIFSDLLHHQFGHEGVHLEHSPGYHVFALKIVHRLAKTGWYAGMPQVIAAIEMAENRTPWFVHPDGLLSGIGDSSRVPVGSLPKSKATGVVGRLFKEAGYAVIRNWFGSEREAASMLLVAGGHHSNSHKHADCLSFELFDRGRHIVVDTGKYSYSRQDWRRFTDSAAAHNAIDILEDRPDNGVKDTTPVGGMLSRMFHPEWGWIVTGEFERPDFGIAHARTFLYRPGEWLVLLDRVTRDKPGRMTAWLHLAPELEAQPFGGGWTFPGGSIRYVTSRSAAQQRRRGALTPQIQGWNATAYHGRTPNDALGLTTVGDDTLLATIIGLGDEPLPDVSLSDAGFRVVHGERVIFEGRTPLDAGEPGLAFV